MNAFTNDLKMDFWWDVVPAYESCMRCSAWRGPKGTGDRYIRVGGHRTCFTHQVWVVHTYEAEGHPMGDGFAEQQRTRMNSVISASPVRVQALRASGIDVPHRRGAGRLKNR